MNQEIILKEIIDIGQAMLENGAEVSRAEDSMRRMVRAYRARECDCFILTSVIIITVQWHDGTLTTQIRNVKNGTADFDKLDYLNDLSRYVVKHCPSEETLAAKFNAVMNRKRASTPAFFLGAILVSSGFCVFFGGGAADGVCAGIIGFAVMLVNRYFLHLEDNVFVHDFILSFLIGLMSGVFSQFVSGVDSSKVTIGCIMMLISGLGMTNGIRDMLHRDIVSGFLRIVNACMGAAAIASGVMLAMVIFRRF